MRGFFRGEPWLQWVTLFLCVMGAGILLSAMFVESTSVFVGATFYIVMISMTAAVAYRGLARSFKEQQQVLERSHETLRDFVYYTAHRLRTPLNVMRWASDIIKTEEAGKLNRRQRETVAELEQALVSVIELADDLQDSLIAETSQTLKLNRTLSDVADLIDRATGEVAVLAREREVKLVWGHPTRRCCSVYGDVGRLSASIENILKNAILYNVHDGHVYIQLSLAHEVAPAGVRARFGLSGKKGDFVYIRVQDSGIGIPPEETSHVFERFFRGKKARALWVDGAGIGLSVSRAIVQMHGGAIWFTRNPGGGTTFFVSLPAYQCAAHEGLLASSASKLVQKRAMIGKR